MSGGALNSTQSNPIQSVICNPLEPRPKAPQVKHIPGQKHFPSTVHKYESSADAAGSFLCLHKSLFMSVKFMASIRRYTATIFRFLPRDASAERGNATVSRPSVCPSVCLSVTFRYQQHIGWNSSKIISRPNSLGPLLWLRPNMGDLVQRKHRQN